ncbi:MAG: hypothetical protein J5722_09755 [Oscillospiraceae bacterium]|nr:hypothetical protein [Oscillospiraceae bacterium]
MKGYGKQELQRGAPHRKAESRRGSLTARCTLYTGKAVGAWLLNRTPELTERCRLLGTGAFYGSTEMDDAALGSEQAAA